jgi:hypothetical protein
MSRRAGWIRRLPALAGVLAVTVAVGCGGDDDDEPAPAGRDLTAVYCPMQRAGTEAGTPQLEPAKDAFDTSALIGLQLVEASDRAAQHGCDVIVSVANGEGQAVPVEIDLKAIYVHTEDGVVTRIEGVGGGI